MTSKSSTALQALDNLAQLLSSVYEVPGCCIGISQSPLSGACVSTESIVDSDTLYTELQEILSQHEDAFIEKELDGQPIRAHLKVKATSLVVHRILGQDLTELGFIAFFLPENKSFSSNEKDTLKGFAAQAAHIIEQSIPNEQKVPETSETLFQRVMSHGRGQLCIHDSEGKLLYVNQSVCDSLGYSRESLLRKKLIDLIPDAYKGEYRKYIYRMHATGKMDGVIELLDCMGKHRYWSYNNALDVERGYVISFSLDITNIVKQRKRLEQREETVKHARQMATRGTWQLDLHTKNILLSTEAQEIFGEDAERATDLQGLLSLIHHKDRSEFESQLKNAIESKGRLLSEQRYVAADKSIKHLLLNGHIKEDSASNSWILNGLIEDISHRIHWEKELVRGKESAGELKALKQEFLANMSHEIRTPVSSIIGFARLLLDNDLPNQERRYAELIFSAGESLLTLVNDVLDFSKMEAGELKLKEGNYNLKECLDKLVSSHKEEAQNKGLRLLSNLHDSLPTDVFGDEKRLGQIVSNLLSNAIKFTRSGYIELAALQTRSNEGERIQIVVSDSGIGIEHHKLDQIFNSFQQGEGSHNRTFGGTGLGLSITKELVELMKGDIKVASTPGQGSTFTVSLPYKNSTVKTEDKASKPSLAAQFDFSQHQILMAEDNANNQMLAQAYMKRVKANIDMANDGVEALEMLENKAYDLVLMDIQMPRMDGIECAMKIREREKWNHIPIIALTAHAFPEDKKRTEQAGMNAHITKPFNPKALYQTMADLLGVGNAEKNEPVPTTKRFDLKHILEYAMNDEGLFISLLQTLLRTLPKNIAGLENGLQQRDLAEIKSFTHTVKPSITMFEEPEANQLILNIEKSDRFDMQLEQKALFLAQMLKELHATVQEKLLQSAS